MKRYPLLGAASIALSAMLALPASAQQPKPQYGGELVLTGQLDKTMFPGRNTDAQGMDVYLNSCETLVELTADREIRPLLAESWTASADKKTVTFKLRQGVQFHDGTPFNAEAVAAVFNEALAKKFLYVSLLEGLQKVVADNEYQVSFQMSAPSAALIPNLAYRTMCIFSPTAYKAKGEEGLGSNIIGTGPFVQTEYTKGVYALFKRNDKYWQKGKPYLDSIRILFVPDVTTRLAMLESGDVDRAAGIPNFDVPRMAKDKSIALRTIPSLQQHYIVINNLVKPLDDPRVRQALNYASDKAGIVKSVFAGTGATLSKAPTLSPGVFGFADMREPERYDLPFRPCQGARAPQGRRLRGSQWRRLRRGRPGQDAVAETVRPQGRDGRLRNRSVDQNLSRKTRHQDRTDRARKRDVQRRAFGRTEGREVRPRGSVLDDPDGRSDEPMMRPSHEGLEAGGRQPHVLLQSGDGQAGRTGPYRNGSGEAGHYCAPVDGGANQARAGDLSSDAQPH
jgi:hypothetical protein